MLSALSSSEWGFGRATCENAGSNRGATVRPTETMTNPLPDDLRTPAGLLRASASPAPGHGLECLDEATIAALVNGTLEPDARSRAIGHLASCAACRRAVAAVAGALADPSIGREIAAVDSTGRRRFLRIVLPAAAAAMLLLLAWPPGSGPDKAPHRGPAIPSAQAPVLLSPLGAVAGAKALRWVSLAGADRYRVTLFDSAGGLLYETETRDTVTALPDSIALVPGRSYLWKVAARMGWDRWSASDLVEFRVAGGDSR